MTAITSASFSGLQHVRSGRCRFLQQGASEPERAPFVLDPELQRQSLHAALYDPTPDGFCHAGSLHVRKAYATVLLCYSHSRTYSRHPVEADARRH